MMRFTQGLPFHLSAAFHGGELVINYRTSTFPHLPSAFLTGPGLGPVSLPSHSSSISYATPPLPPFICFPLPLPYITIDYVTNESLGLE